MGEETVRERGGVEYRELQSRSLLNRCDAPRMPFTWTVNPYRGCAMGCRYCYAAYTHEFMGIAGADFHSLVYVKTGARRRRHGGWPRSVRSGETIALGTATDPYQPAEAEARVTRRFLEMVAGHRNVRLGIVTKGALILRDIELLQKIHMRSRLNVHVSLISPHAELVRKLEPWAPPPEVRIEVMRRLVEAGIEVSLGLAPVLPGLTDDEASLDLLLEHVAAAGRAAHVHQRAVPALAHAREVPGLAGRGVPPLPRGVREGLRDPRLPRRAVSPGHRRAGPPAEGPARVRRAAGRARLAPPGADKAVLTVGFVVRVHGRRSCAISFSVSPCLRGLSSDG